MYEPLNDVRPFLAVDPLQKSLLRYYIRTGHEEKKANSFAYQNTLPFLHRFLQGERLLNTQESADLHIQPLLLYYGFTEFLKAIILFYQPSYPETTSVLAHGLSTRKRKKKDYRFIDDEVKTQRNGLFPLLSSKMFQLTIEEGTRFKMSELFIQLHDMESIIRHDARMIPPKNMTIVPELLTHHMLLYNLSMISRYESEWWGELITSRLSQDVPLIELYLQQAGNRIRTLIREETLKGLITM
ncbi:YaaC family protein [Geomicrobium sp. JCM 19038]|uniref:YaaC family protein n=1 Tax=Geomicrobium sp. JCM 19038 TaxID=1460635 RepID=UPI00045F147A|nr:YaaC family protein [Geomicrobium sp. JCM 19038]GAK06902.1 hypothetical protein JCM19038_616 [Geomicrobium sp. JCM 19038]